MKNRIFRTIRGSAPGGPIAFPAKVASLHSGLVPDLVKRGRDLLAASWNWLREQQQSRLRARQLHLEESISLGQKRFVALIRVDGHRLLVGGGATDVVLLASLDAGAPISALFRGTAREWATAPKPVPAKRKRKRAARTKVKPEKCA